MNPFEQLLQQLPPERRVAAALALDKLGDRNSPIYSLYVEVLTSIEVKNREAESRLAEKLAATERHAKELGAQIAKGQSETVKTIHGEINTITGKGLGWRIMANKLIGTIIYLVVASVLANHIIQSKLTTDPEVERQLASMKSDLQQRIDGQALLTNAKIKALDNNIAKISHATTYESLLGKAISLYVFQVDEKHMTLFVDDEIGNYKGYIVINHNLDPKELSQLQMGIKIAQKIKTE